MNYLSFKALKFIYCIVILSQCIMIFMFEVTFALLIIIIFKNFKNLLILQKEVEKVQDCCN